MLQIFRLQINGIIDEAISNFGLPVCKVAEPDVEISIVESSVPALRGFVGINQIFIHADNFGDKIKTFKGSLELLQMVAKIDIISVVIHEWAHVKIRRITNDLNTPARTNIPPPQNGEIEFGVYVERKVFGKQVNWFETASMLRQKGKAYVNMFIASIEEQTSLPEGHVIDELIEREDVLNSVSGLDIEVKSQMC